MKFEEIIKELLDGKVATRDEWDNNKFILLHNDILILIKRLHGECFTSLPFCITTIVLHVIDWKVVEFNHECLI